MILTSEQQKTIIDDILHQIDKKTLHLASLPDLVIKINDIINDDTKGPQDAANVIQFDISLSSRIIQISNSPSLRGYKEIVSIADAIKRLGLNFVRNLVLCVTMRDKFSIHNKSSASLTSLVFNSIHRSIYSFIIAKSLGKPFSPDMALIAGLVSQIGEIVLVRYISDHDEYENLSSDEITRLAEEYGPHLTKIIVSKWEFPSNIVNSMFSEANEANFENPATYHDVIKLAEFYIDNKDRDDLEIIVKTREMTAELMYDVTMLQSIFF